MARRELLIPACPAHSGRSVGHFRPTQRRCPASRRVTGSAVAGAGAGADRGVLGGGSGATGLDLPRRGRVPGSVGSRRGRRGPARARHDVEHVEGAGAGGQSVSIGGSSGQAHAGEGKGEGSWPCARRPASRPPARPDHHGGGPLAPGPTPRPDRRRWEGTLPPGPLRSCPGLLPGPSPRPARHRPFGQGRGRGWRSGVTARRGTARPLAGRCLPGSREAEGGGRGHWPCGVRCRVRPWPGQCLYLVGFFCFLGNPQLE